MTMSSNTDLQKIRSQAAQAAATCSVAVGLGDASGFLRVASMIETYIREGEKAAQAVIDSWSAPQSGASPASAQSRAQELADEASVASSVRDVQDVQKKAESEGVSEDQVTVDGVTGSLTGYLEHLLESARPKSDATRRADLGLSV